MVKTKGESSTTAKIKELTGKKPEKISEEELKKIQDTINSINKLQMEIGMMETRKHQNLHNIAGLNDQLTLVQEEFNKEYGTDEIDINTGEIKYPENGEVNKED